MRLRRIELMGAFALVLLAGCTVPANGGSKAVGGCLAGADKGES